MENGGGGGDGHLDCTMISQIVAHKRSSFGIKSSFWLTYNFS